MEFGDRIKYQRERLNLSREDLANKLQIKYHTLAKYETNDREPDYETLVQIANTLGVTTDYILGKNQIKTSSKGKSLSLEKERLSENIESIDDETAQKLSQYLNYLKFEKEDKKKTNPMA